MPLVAMRPLLESAQKNGYAFGAFNVNTVCQAEAVIEMHQMLRSAAIIQGADLANAFMGGRADFKNGTLEDKKRGAARIAEVVRKLSEKADIPIVLHLDHGRDFDAVKAAIDCGYTSVMIDGSSLPYEENVELTREVVRYAHHLGVTVEGELGVLAGVEDDVFSESSTYTNPMQVCDFVRKTGVDCLAISYGTKHGAVKGDNIRLRQEIVIASMENLRHEKLFSALVSHGSSSVPGYIVQEINALGGQVKDAGGIPMAQLRTAVANGISKVNIDTDIRLAVTRNIRELFSNQPQLKTDSSLAGIWALMEENPQEVDPRGYITPLMEPLITGSPLPGPEGELLIDAFKRGVYEIVGLMTASFGSAGRVSAVAVKSLEEMASHYRQKGI